MYTLFKAYKWIQHLVELMFACDHPLSSACKEVLSFSLLQLHYMFSLASVRKIEPLLVNVIKKDRFKAETNIKS